MKKVENIKKTLVLGESGAVVECMLLDAPTTIKSKNPKLTDADVEITYNLLQSEIIRKESEIEENQEE